MLSPCYVCVSRHSKTRTRVHEKSRSEGGARGSGMSTPTARWRCCPPLIRPTPSASSPGTCVAAGSGGGRAGGRRRDPPLTKLLSSPSILLKNCRMARIRHRRPPIETHRHTRTHTHGVSADRGQCRGGRNTRWRAGRRRADAAGEIRDKLAAARAK
jgi:hypothetical protein